MGQTYWDLIRPIPAKYNLTNVYVKPGLPTCDVCRVAVPDRSKAKRNLIETPFERIDTYPEFPSLESSARDGCGMCWIIRSAIRSSWAVRPMEEWGVGPLDEHDMNYFDLLDSPWDGKVHIFNLKFIFDPLLDPKTSSGYGNIESEQQGGMITAMTLEFGPAPPKVAEDGSSLHGEISQVLRFKAYDSIDLNAQDANCRRMLPDQETLSPRNIKMMQAWIEDCESNHALCRLPPSATPWLPTRLLDVGDRNKSVHPRIVETNGMLVGSVVYAALSHMWGDVYTAPPLQTMQYNYSALQQSISPDRLPLNFLNALVTCLSLGIQYIWIDSLCIIQDSEEDWRREAETMHMVYKNARVTIVATSATSTHDGFLARNLSVVPSVMIGYAQTETNHTLILTPVDDVEKGLRRGDVDGSQWNNRGWTMQERSLSTRLIHFCRNKIYFECRGCLKSEENEPETRRGSDPFRLWPRPFETSSDDASKWYERWRKLVVEYSRRRLTVQSDKLTAIRSVANEMAANVLPDSYLSAQATWRGNISNELLWYVESGIGRKSKLPKSLEVRSWSWVSLDAHIGFVKGQRVGKEPAGDRSTRAFQVRECDSRGILVLSGFITSSVGIRTGEDRNLKWTSFPYDVLDEVDNRLIAHGLLDLDNRDNLLGLHPRDRSICYFHVSDEQHPSGLLLRRVDGGMWCRVGVATIFHTSGEMMDPTLFEGPFEREESLYDTGYLQPGGPVDRLQLC